MLLDIDFVPLLRARVPGAVGEQRRVQQVYALCYINVYDSIPKIHVPIYSRFTL